jgi:hypothetical protein
MKKIFYYYYFIIITIISIIIKLKINKVSENSKNYCESNSASVGV